MKCLVCGKGSVSHFCVKCLTNFPTDFSKSRPAEELLTEYHRNKRLKDKFSADKKLGRMELDVLNGIFHIGNCYHSITELKEYSFNSTTPKFEGVVWRRDVTEDIIFTYRLHNGVKNSVKLATVRCPYRNDGKYVTVEPPLKLFGYKQQFAEVVHDISERLANNIEKAGGFPSDIFI